MHGSWDDDREGRPFVSRSSSWQFMLLMRGALLIYSVNGATPFVADYRV